MINLSWKVFVWYSDNQVRKSVKQRIMDPVVNYIKGGKLIISFMCVSPDFPATLKYAEPDSTWTNCIWKFDLNCKQES